MENTYFKSNRYSITVASPPSSPLVLFDDTLHLSSQICFIFNFFNFFGFFKKSSNLFDLTQISSHARIHSLQPSFTLLFPKFFFDFKVKQPSVGDKLSADWSHSGRGRDHHFHFLAKLNFNFKNLIFWEENQKRGFNSDLFVIWILIFLWFLGWVFVLNWLVTAQEKSIKVLSAQSRRLFQPVRKSTWYSTILYHPK